MASPQSRKAPQRLGRYELLRRIGVGGMGEVWLSRTTDEADRIQICVVKRMLQHLSGDREFVERFLDEAKVVIHLNHPNIARVFEMGEVGGAYFMAMEYVEGKTVGRLAARLRERKERLPPALALHLGVRLSDALAYAHRATDPSRRPLHVVHRDISPANVLVSYDGAVKIIDFGAALSTIKEARTAPRVVIGNLAYMSPEQARKRAVDGRADVYSASVVLWELLTGQPLGNATDGADNADRWRRAAYPAYTSPSKFARGIPAEVDAVVMRGLAPDPRERHQNADALRDALQGALDRLAPKTRQADLAQLMERLFADDLAADHAQVREALKPSPSSPAARAAAPQAHLPAAAAAVTGPNSLAPAFAGDDEDETLIADLASIAGAGLVAGSGRPGVSLTDPTASLTDPPESFTGPTTTVAPPNRGADSPAAPPGHHDPLTGPTAVDDPVRARAERKRAMRGSSPRQVLWKALLVFFATLALGMAVASVLLGERGAPRAAPEAPETPADLAPPGAERDSPLR